MTPEEFINKWIGFIMPDDLKAVRADLNSIFNHSVDTNEMLADQPDPKPEWISVKIKPNDRRMVDVTNGRKVTVGWYCAEHKRWLIECFPYIRRVLFWKERPTPPKK